MYQLKVNSKETESKVADLAAKLREVKIPIKSGDEGKYYAYYAYYKQIIDANPPTKDGDGLILIWKKVEHDMKSDKSKRLNSDSLSAVFIPFVTIIAGPDKAKEVIEVMKTQFEARLELIRVGPRGLWGGMRG